MTELKPCPVCEKPAEKYMGYDNGKVGCKNQDCNYRNRPQYPDDWNNRPHENKIKADAVREWARQAEANNESEDRMVNNAYNFAHKLERGE